MYGFLFIIIEPFSLALTVEALQGKTCQDSLLSGGGRSLGAKVSGEGVVFGEYFLVCTKLDTFCYLTVQTAPCCVSSFWHNTGVWQTDRQTDGIAVASTALAMRALRLALRRAEKATFISNKNVLLHKYRKTKARFSRHLLYLFGLETKWAHSDSAVARNRNNKT